MKRCSIALAALAILFGAAVSEGATMANLHTLLIPGGQLDPAYPDADVYIATPVAAKAPQGRACAVAQRYVTLINAGDYAGVAALYADDATFLEPMRPSLHGRAQIDAFYTKRIGSMKPQILAVSYLGNNRECMITLTRRVEMDGRQRYVLVSVDHFIVDRDSKIVSMAAFARPVRG